MPDRRHFPQVAFAFLAGLGRLPFTLADGVRLALAAPKSSGPPIFILGHWRSGTTHLYNILSQAPQFAFVTPFQTALPWDFLSLTALFGRLLTRALPADRYIDSIPVTPEAPQEDEIGIANMTTLSFYHALYFPRAFEKAFNEGLFFDGVGEDRIARWGRRVESFYKRLSVAEPGRHLLIKNPVYTARVSELLKHWPDAQFIHIHRNPYKVFFSMRNFYDRLFSELALQPWEDVAVDKVIFDSYLRMMRRFDKDRQALAEDQLLELRFDELQQRPLEVLDSLYRHFGWTDFGADRERFENYLNSVRRYQKNVYEFPPDDLDAIDARWGDYIARWNYRRPAVEAA